MGAKNFKIMKHYYGHRCNSWQLTTEPFVSEGRFGRKVSKGSICTKMVSQYKKTVKVVDQSYKRHLPKGITANAVKARKYYEEIDIGICE